MKMRAAVLYEQGKPRPYAESHPLVIEEVDLDPPGPDEALIEIAAAGLCHSDLSAIEGIRARALPVIIGHESAGIVREVGANVTEAKPGDHVITSFVTACGCCAPCIEGRPNLCATSWSARSSGALISGGRRLSVRGEPINHGSGISCFAQYAVVSRHALVRIDPDISLDDAALFGCAVMTGVGAVVNTARVQPGAVVAVIGLGGVGLNALLGAVVSGAERIIAIDTRAEKLGLARQLGATETYDATDPDCAAKVIEATRGGVEYAFEMAGMLPALELAYRICRRGGTTVTAGLPHHEHTLSIPVAAMVSDERTIKGSYMGSCNFRRDIPRFLALYRQGKLPVDRLKSGVVDLDGINAGFDRLAEGNVVRQILHP
ncbi:MAG: alcohol dehydrogenase catalytic domain-containing protein [Chromatiales bacterium]|nr:alcohol dehydrogenase catalytic domain-containing protein [Chromatiales bacterium]